MIYDSKQNVVCVVSAREEHEGGGDAPQVSLLPPGQPPHWPAAGAQGGVKVENILNEWKFPLCLTPTPLRLNGIIF